MLASKEKLSGTHTVYNLEVRELHNFLVGKEGVVVHNNYSQILNNFLSLSLQDKLKMIDNWWNEIYPEIFNARKWMEELMGYYYFKKSHGWKGTSDLAQNFKAIDFYKPDASVRVAASMKTTTVNDVGNWISQNSNHLTDLVNGKNSGQFIWGNNTVLADKVELHIFMPKENYSISLAQTWKQAIEAQAPGVDVFISKLENHIY